MRVEYKFRIGQPYNRDAMVLALMRYELPDDFHETGKRARQFVFTIDQGWVPVKPWETFDHLHLPEMDGLIAHISEVRYRLLKRDLETKVLNAIHMIPERWGEPVHDDAEATAAP